MRVRIAALAAPLRRPRLRRLVAAFLVNELGDGIAIVVLPLLVYDATGSGFLTGGVFAMLRAFGVIGRPIGGLLADRLDRLAVLRTTFVLRGGLLALGLLARSDRALVLCLLLAAFVGTIDNPSGEAAIREGSGTQAQQVATIRKVSRALSGVVGLAVGGVLVGTVGVEVAVALDIATYAVAILLLPPIASSAARGTRPSPVPRDGWLAASRRALTATLADAREGLQHLRGQRDLRVVSGTMALAAGVVTALLTVAVVWLDGLPDAPDGAYGIALASYSAGAILGLVVAGMIAWRITVPRLAARTLVLAGLACAFGVVGSDWRVLCLSWMAWGIVWGPFEVWGDTRLVALTPERLRGRAYGGVGMLAAVGQVVGGVAAGMLADVTDPRVVIVGLGGMFLLASAYVAGTRVDRVAAVDGR